MNKKGKYEIFLCKANGIRYWNSTRTKIWGIPKGRPDKKEKGFDTARREFFEETGNVAPELAYQKLCKFDTPHNKVITVYIADATGIKGIKFRGANVLTVEYPAGSGQSISYPEIATAKWFTLKEAKKRMMWGQKDMLDIIESHIKITTTKGRRDDVDA